MVVLKIQVLWVITLCHRVCHSPYFESWQCVDLHGQIVQIFFVLDCFTL